MSWSINAIGKPEKVSERLKNQITNCKCSEPEETIKSKVGEILELCLSAYPADHPVEITASGSQSSAKDDKAINQLQINVKPLWGFVE